MHLIQIVRNYLGMTQHALSKAVGITQPDLCEMELKKPYGRIDKYQRLSDYLGIPVHALVNNDCSLVGALFFDKHPCAAYMNATQEDNQPYYRKGENSAFVAEQHRVEQYHPHLSKLVLPYYKMRIRPGYDILSFGSNGRPIYVEVKTSIESGAEFSLTRHEYEVATKAIAEGDQYFIYHYTSWGKEDQALTIHDFREMKESFDFSVATYNCSIKKRSSIITGIQYYRELRGMSKSELAAFLGIKTPHLWKYETGEYKCSVEMYQKMACILDTTIDALISTYSCDN